MGKSADWKKFLRNLVPIQQKAEEMKGKADILLTISLPVTGANQQKDLLNELRRRRLEIQKTIDEISRLKGINEERIDENSFTTKLLQNLELELSEQTVLLKATTERMEESWRKHAAAPVPPAQGTQPLPPLKRLRQPAVFFSQTVQPPAASSTGKVIQGKGLSQEDNQNLVFREEDFSSAPEHSFYLGKGEKTRPTEDTLLVRDLRGATSGAFKSSLPFVKSDKAHEQLFRHLLYKDLTLDVSGAALTPELFKEGRRRIEEKANKSLKNAKEANTIKEQVVNARGERRKELLKSNLDNLDDKKLQKEGFAVSEMDPKGQSFDLLHKNNKTGEETIPFATVTHLEATGKVSLQFSNANPKNEETVKAIMALSVFAPSPHSQIRISNASPAMAARLAVQIMASGHQPV